MQHVVRICTDLQSCSGRRYRLTLKRAGCNWQVVTMPYFNFDLIVGDELRSQGGMILEDAEGAIDKADCLASELCIARPELQSRGFSVRVVDGDSHELYRTAVNPRS